MWTENYKSLQNKDYFYKSSCHSPSSHSNNSPSRFLLWLTVFCSPVVIATPQERLEALWYKDVGGLSSSPAKDKQDFNTYAGINTFIILHHSHKTALVASMQTALVPCLRWNATQTFLTHQWVSWMGKFWRLFFLTVTSRHRWLKKKKLAILFTAHLPIALYS